MNWFTIYLYLGFFSLLAIILILALKFANQKTKKNIKKGKLNLKEWGLFRLEEDSRRGENE